jgi:Protein of unknown function (DUF3105)
MPKKKRRKKRTTRPTAPPAGRGAERAEATRPPSHRAERKEQARRERERRIKQARRRQRIRRATRWGVALAVVGGIGAFAWVQVRANQESKEAAREAAGRVGCGAIQTSPDLTAGLSSTEIHSPPFTEGTGGVPATNGRHSSPLPPEPAVYDQPIPEASAVHNLEHGYVIIYYRNQGADALSEDIVASLENLAESEDKVLMAPYPDLANGFDLVAWRKLQTCDPGEDADPGDAVTVARGFISQFLGGGLAPEPGGV